jgi:hypothetical protein
MAGQALEAVCMVHMRNPGRSASELQWGAGGACPGPKGSDDSYLVAGVPRRLVDSCAKGGVSMFSPRALRQSSASCQSGACVGSAGNP